MFQPLSRTAYLFKKSLITYDGKAVLLPSKLLTTTSKCKFVLTRDFMQNMFTVYLSEEKLTIQLVDGNVVIPMDKPRVMVFPRTRMGVSPSPITDLPLRLQATVVKQLSRDVVHINNAVGLDVYCDLTSFACNFTIPGFYHNKTLGLFGTNNAESSDDFRIPNGELASDLSEFLNGWEISKSGSCDVDMNVLRPPTSNNYECEDPQLKDYNGARGQAFRTSCGVEDSCPVFRSFASSLLKETGDETVRIPMRCECRNTESIVLKNMLSGDKPVVQISLLIKLVPEMKAAIPQIQSSLKYLESSLKDFVQLKYNVIGFSGSDICREPHIHTAGGEVTYGLMEALNVLNRLKFTGNETTQKLGMSALELVAPLQTERGSRIVLLFENDSTYTNLLQQMNDVSSVLYDHGLILNVVNNYKRMTRNNVVAKDSHGTRYNVYKPKGELFKRGVSFPPTDDYIPYVKQTKGAAISLKAFTSGNAAWTKALPISLSELLRKQIDADLKQCKQCACANSCRNVGVEECDIVRA